MHLYGWVILIALLFGLGLLLKRSWLAQQAHEEQSEIPDAPLSSAQSRIAQVAKSVQERVQGVRNGLASKEEDNAVAQFRKLAPHAFAAHPELHQWVGALTDEQLTALIHHLSEFCHDMGFELHWLFEKEVSSNAALMKGLTEIILFYSRASYQAVRLQEEVEMFRIYREFLQNPKSRTNRELGEHLFGKLMEQGKGSVKISEHLAASTRKRQQQIIETIQQVAIADPQLLTATLKLVLVERALSLQNAATTPTNGAAATPTTKAAAA